MQKYTENTIFSIYLFNLYQINVLYKLLNYTKYYNFSNAQLYSNNIIFKLELYDMRSNELKRNEKSEARSCAMISEFVLTAPFDFVNPLF